MKFGDQEVQDPAVVVVSSLHNQAEPEHMLEGLFQLRRAKLTLYVPAVQDAVLQPVVVPKDSLALYQAGLVEVLLLYVQQADQPVVLNVLDSVAAHSVAIQTPVKAAVGAVQTLAYLLFPEHRIQEPADIKVGSMYLADLI